MTTETELATEPGPAADSPQSMKKYWHEHMRLVFCLMLIWFVASFGCGVLFVDELNSIKLGGFKLGFWFAQQGSIYIFLIIIFTYSHLMHRLDCKYGVDDVE